MDQRGAVCRTFLILVLSLSSGTIQARDYFIPRGEGESQPKISRGFQGRTVGVDLEIPGGNSTQGILFGLSDCDSPISDNGIFLEWVSRSSGVQIFAVGRSRSHDQRSLVSESESVYGGTIQMGLSADSHFYEVRVGDRATRLLRGCQTPEITGVQVQPHLADGISAPEALYLKVSPSFETAPVFVDLPFPNPSTGGRFSLKAQSWDRVALALELTDFTGQVVWRSSSSALRAGAEEMISFGVNDFLPAGNFYYLNLYGILTDGSRLPVMTRSDQTLGRSRYRMSFR